ncbi:phage Gp37/Gp68 family protein [Streptomyces scabiei]|uniref:DUF5131 family protein n=1 Tax=Streptomyces scabiei TaxID=1930 RepID=UPI001B30F730|nr:MULTISPECIES: phage Gp37/Gp68 family protein [Streptomyces]MDX2749593.1 phage Gp37/Gp68 family protein [Streptomyces scabiei]MDX3146539.1 phage Gp37/Gp68 family protein [Streptomyces scabiei]MDX3196945.1 phage Gp37/Gp68 family protein [Streptomyces scabiei]QTU45913.1 phage Gp37/Gp68 family protein [Streptomyces sp. LBUM 1482]
MSATTKIEWTDRTWNPVTGCTKVSPGCDNCYAETIAHRFAGSKAFPNGFDVTLHDQRLDQPSRWTKSARVFVNSMSDLFHDSVPDLFITRVFDVMEANPRHTFQVLTKRHARMRSFVQQREQQRREYAAKFDDCPTEAMRISPAAQDARARAGRPPANIWLGVSVEDQKWADIRIPALLETPAAVRFLSCEPLLGPVDLCGPIVPGRGRPKLTYWLDGRPGWGPEQTDDRGRVFQGLAVGPRIDWVIVGGESGPQARPMHPDWARALRDQCTVSGTAFFLKQLGEWQPLGPLYGDLEDTDDGHMEAVHLDAVEGKQVIQLESNGYIAEGHQPADSRTWLMARVGKKRAGRELDGRVHDAFPQPPRDDFHASIEAGLTEDFDAFSRRLDAAPSDTHRRP